MANDNISALLAMKGSSGGGGGSGAKRFVVTVTESGGVYSADKTVAEINAAYAAGKTVIAKYGSMDFALYKNTMGLILEFVAITYDSAIPTMHILYGAGGSVDTWTYDGVIVSEAPATVTDLSSTSITLASAADNTIYEYGELTALTVTAITATGDFIIRFTSGATATTTNFPNTMKFSEAFAAEANTRYEINVSNGYALAVGWPTT